MLAIAAKRGHGRHDSGSVIRWCFADPKIADTFVREFGRTANSKEAG